MKKIRDFVVIATMLFASGAMFTSCIKEEALNAEADIEKATIEDASSILQLEPSITNNKVTFKLKQFAARHDFAPEFILTEGATIEPASGTERNFETPQKYTVTSEDGMWEKEYTVEFVVDEGTLLVYTFENQEIVHYVIEDDWFPVTIGPLPKFFDYATDMTTKRDDWDSGNLGFDFLLGMIGGKTDEYDADLWPTAQTADGYIGSAAKLKTVSTGDLGGAFGAPIAAGSLFMGSFNRANVTNTVKATEFGQAYTYDSAPKAVSGYFKYKAGDNFVVNNAPSELTKDTWDAYAILFEKTSEKNYITGDHGFNDPRMVSVARIDNATSIETDEWTPFEMEFEFVDGKSFDPEKEYMFTIVFSSSKEGAIFNGAVGSTLYVDEVFITLDEEENIEE